MASLNVVELSKFRNGEYRWKIFERKLDNEEAFEFTPEAQKRFGVKKDFLKPLDPDFFEYNLYKGYETGDFSALTGVKFQGEVSKCTIGLTNLQKTAEFGSSAGMGGGTAQTYLVEKRTALECAKKTGGTFDTIVTPTWHNYQINGVIEQQKEKGLDSSWDSSFSSTVDSIVYSKATFGMPDYHHDDDLVGWIKDSYKRCKLGTPYQVRNFNKWNPADIWCSSGSVWKISSSLADCSTLEELKDVCYGPTLKGISLKKDGTTVKEVKSEPKPWKVEKMEFLGWKGNQWIAEGSCLRVKFNFEGGPDKLLIVRSEGTKFRAEVLTVGSNHRNGSCGMTQLNGILDEYQAGCRFTSLKNCPDKFRKEEARKQLYRFVQYLSYEMLACIVRHCVCQAKGHCTYLKIS